MNQSKLSETKNIKPQNFLLAKLVSSKIGGGCNNVYLVDKIQDLIYILKNKEKQDTIILGSGTKTIISDEGFNGSIIFNRCSNINPILDYSQVIVDGGTLMEKFINKLIEFEFSGLEYFAGQRGTVAGQLLEKNTLYNQKLSSYVKSITVFNLETGKIGQFSSKWLERTNFNLSRTNQRWVILNIKFQFSKGRRDTIYQKTRNFFKKNHFEIKDKGYLENAFFEHFSIIETEKLTRLLNLPSNTAYGLILKSILSDYQIKKIYSPFMQILWCPNNVFIFKKPINARELTNCLDEIIIATYDKFKVKLKPNYFKVG